MLTYLNKYHNCLSGYKTRTIRFEKVAVKVTLRIITYIIPYEGNHAFEDQHFLKIPEHKKDAQNHL